MDFSSAGYLGGGVALPEVPVKRMLKPSGGDDDSAAIQEAIDAVAAMAPEGNFRGAVLLAPGVYSCAKTIIIPASGIVLRGSGSAGDSRSTIRMVGSPHLAIAVRNPSADRRGDPRPADDAPATSIADTYVPSGVSRFTVADASGFKAGDHVAIIRPVTEEWVRFMEMDNLVRDEKPQTWMKPGSSTTTERQIVAISGKELTLDVPLSDSFDARKLNPPGTRVVKVSPSAIPAFTGIEDLHIQSPPQAISHTESHYTALRINAQDSWVRDVLIDETMNSVGLSGKRLTLQRVTVNRKAVHQGSSKPAEFAPNGGQILLDRCSVTADNVWFSATGAGQAGPIVLLNCTFRGNGNVEAHQRWTTGMLVDGCQVPEGGIEFRNRGSMGSGHGWSTGWSVAWNCVAKSYIIQQPPGAVNWAIGCSGERRTAPRPFGKGPALPEGTFESAVPVAPKSLYLAQLAERLGPQALKNIGY